MRMAYVIDKQSTQLLSWIPLTRVSYQYELPAGGRDGGFPRRGSIHALDETCHAIDHLSNVKSTSKQSRAMIGSTGGSQQSFRFQTSASGGAEILT